MVKAVAVLISETINGTISFSQEGDSPVQVNGQLTGLKQGLHGFHLHEFGDFIRSQKYPGGLRIVERHIVYFGNIEANAEGVAKVSITNKQISLSGPNNIIGHSVMVYTDPDDLNKYAVSKTTGNAIGPLACAVIELTQPS